MATAASAAKRVLVSCMVEMEAWDLRLSTFSRQKMWYVFGNFILYLWQKLNIILDIHFWRYQFILRMRNNMKIEHISYITMG